LNTVQNNKKGFRDGSDFGVIGLGGDYIAMD
jgi:hypothetical protein